MNKTTNLIDSTCIKDTFEKGVELLAKNDLRGCPQAHQAVKDLVCFAAVEMAYPVKVTRK